MVGELRAYVGAVGADGEEGRVPAVARIGTLKAASQVLKSAGPKACALFKAWVRLRVGVAGKAWSN